MIIAVDFDGTIVEHAYPDIGPPVPHAIESLHELQEKHQIILLTMRHDCFLRDAVNYLVSNGVRLFAVNENPEQSSWTQSQKVYAHRYIDDAAVGCPLIYHEGKRPYVDWPAVMGLLK